MVHCQTFSVAMGERNAHLSVPATLLNRESSGENAKWTFCCSVHARRTCFAPVLPRVELTIKFTLLQVIYQDHEWEKGGKYDGTLQNVELPSGLAAMVIFSLLYSGGFRSSVVLEDYGSF